MQIIVDGYNLIRQSDTLRRFEKSGLEAGRRELLRLLSLYRRIKGHRITVVFDGWVSGSPVEEREREGGVTVVYSRRGEKADEVIKRMLGRQDMETCVVTSDRELADFANRRGATAVPAPVFESRLSEAERKTPQGGYMKDGEKEENYAEGTTRGTKKKGPRKRMSKREKTFFSRVKKM